MDDAGLERHCDQHQQPNIESERFKPVLLFSELVTFPTGIA
jgi:hypothetical protein